MVIEQGNQRYVAYFRVSTAKQGKSGLGLEAQKSAVAQFIRQTGGELLGSYMEVESGKRSDRPELIKAIERCDITQSILVVAKLDRLTRDTNFLAKLRDSGVKFVAVDNSSATHMTVTILIAVAEEERRLVSVRTKAALAACKARGQKLGCPLGAAAFGEKRGLGATEGLKRKADAFAQKMANSILALKAEGLSLRQIADRLNADGAVTARGNAWQANSVKRVLDRL